jgi:superfamily II DNA or RNA helicase
MSHSLTEQIEFDLQRMGVNLTGLRPGELCLGVQLCTKDAIWSLQQGLIPPRKDDLDGLRSDPTIWNMFLVKLGMFHFFQSMTVAERAAYLESVEQPGDFDIAEVNDPTLTIEFHELGQSNLLNLEEETITKLLQVRSWTPMDVRNLFPKKAGSKAKRHSLYFFHCYWRIHQQYSFVDKVPSGCLVYSMIDHGIVPQGFDTYKNKNIVLLDGYCGQTPNSKQTIGVHAHFQPNSVSYRTLCYECFPVMDKPILDMLFQLYESFTPSFHKSLMQKVIRFCPIQVCVYHPETYEEVIVPAQHVLYTVFTYLLEHPGAFVPDIQRFVSGQESAIKRLLICIFEDSYVGPEHHEKLLEMAWMCTLTQRVSSWKPSIEQYQMMLTVADEAWSTAQQSFQYDVQAGSTLSPYILDPTLKPLEMISAILDDVKSFAGDLYMIRHIARHTLHNNHLKPVKRPQVMRVEHALDQHCMPEVIYMFPWSEALLYKEKQSHSKPFAGIFRKLFVQVTGMNPRKEIEFSQETMEALPFVSTVRKCQNAAYWAKVKGDSKEKDIIVEHKGLTYPLTYSLPFSWVAGMVGTVEIGITLVSMKPDDPYQYAVIRRPSRGLKDGHLDDVTIEQSIEKMKEQLRSPKGLPLNKAFAPIPSMRHLSVRLVPIVVDGQTEEEYRFYSLKKEKEGKTWAEVSTEHREIPLIPFTQLGTDKQEYLAMVEDAFTVHLPKLFHEVYPERDIWQRFLFYVISMKPRIDLFKIAKDGGSSQETVVYEDIAVCQIMYDLMKLFPGMISRVPHQVSSFRIHYWPLLQEIKQHMYQWLESSSVIVVPEPIIEPVASSSQKKAVKQGTLTGFLSKQKQSPPKQWPQTLVDSTGRTLRSYQIDTVEEMLQKKRKGHFLWITTGLGKTCIVCTYFKKIFESQMNKPTYIVYTLPKSAMKSVIQEFQYFNFPINVLIPLKSYKKKEGDHVIDPLRILPYHVNFIEHDHLRLLEDELLATAGKSICVIDEVHKTLNDTKRTSVALELSRVSMDFIAMTGTPIVDSSTYKLIGWFEQIVDFEVNESNFWVAANGMIAKKVNTGIMVDDQDIPVTMTPEEEQTYRTFMPPGLGGINTRTTMQDIRQAFQHCYAICNREFVKQTIQFVSEGKGVMIVAQHSRHQEELKQLFIQDGHIKAKDIYVLQPEDSIFMTDECVAKGKIPDYKVVIVPMRKSEGYTLTRMQVMITGVYPSNNATREQLRGRINRLSQHAPTVHYRTIHCGILSYVLQKHNNAASLQAILGALAKDISITGL